MDVAQNRRPRLVVFGCGYVGTALVQAALARDWSVAALTRNAETARTLRALGPVEVLVDDLADDAWHGRLLADADYVVDCVGAGGGGLEGYERSYFQGLRSILSWAARGRVGTLIFTSSTSVYPQGAGASVDEDSGHAGVGPTGAVLLRTEALLSGPPPSVGRAVVLRLAGLYGPGRHHLLDALRAGTPAVFPGDGSVLLNLCHRDDAVGAILACCAAPDDWRGGVFNVSDGQPAPKAEVLQWLAAQAACASPRFDATLAPTATRRLFGGQAPSRVIVSARLRQSLGWRPLYADYRAGYAALL